MSDSKDSFVTDGADLDPVDLSMGFSDSAEQNETAIGSLNNRPWWLWVSVFGFLMAFVISILILPMVNAQQQRAKHAKDLVASINSTNASIGQALSIGGNFSQLRANLGISEGLLERATSSDSMLEKITNSLFSNTQSNQAMFESWQPYNKLVNELIASESDISGFNNALLGLVNRLNKSSTDAVTFVDAVAREGRTKRSDAAKDKYLFLTAEASNLNGILGRLSGTINAFNLPNAEISALTDAQSALVVRLQDTLNRIVDNADAVVGTAAEPLQSQFLQLAQQVTNLADKSALLTQARNKQETLKKLSGELVASVDVGVNSTVDSPLIAKVLFFLTILFALAGAFGLWLLSRQKSSSGVVSESMLEETLAEQQDSILKLLDEMSALADGDLTVEAEVTDQITGAIADSVNYAVIEMRELVSQINRASVQVADESKLAVSNAQAVSQANIQQADQVSAAAKLMQSVASSMHEMSTQAIKSSDMASESLSAANQGAESVRDTIRGMEDMRQQIQETSKRIKRLGESSQRIGDIVSLIDDIAEQTNILSLNAAIQASMAGEAGRGFAVVSDEVQNLAERSTDATKRIAELVTAIQNDTNDAVLSMDKATQQVVSGTRVADSAGSALAEIERVSKKFSALIENISETSSEQAEVVSRVAEQVTQVSGSSTETSKKSRDSANSIAKLLELAKELESSVTRFKLPATLS